MNKPLSDDEKGFNRLLFQGKSEENQLKIIKIIGEPIGISLMKDASTVFEVIDNPTLQDMLREILGLG